MPLPDGVMDLWKLGSRAQPLQQSGSYIFNHRVHYLLGNAAIILNYLGQRLTFPQLGRYLGYLQSQDICYTSY